MSNQRVEAGGGRLRAADAGLMSAEVGGGRRHDAGAGFVSALWGRSPTM
jgi:hypothetical protein